MKNISAMEAAQRLVHIKTSFQGKNEEKRSSLRLDEYEKTLSAILADNPDEWGWAMSMIQLWSEKEPSNLENYGWFNEYLSEVSSNEK